ncbi:MAG: transporter substrate-binding domain-containing protein [Candidatus Promineifilaceae bacterium]
MSKRALASLLFLFLFSTACQTRANSWTRIQRDGILRVGLDPTYPPFETLADNSVVGLDAELITQIGDNLGLAIQFDVIGYDGLYDALLTGRVDVLASALIVDETRTKTFAYSNPYFNAGQVLIVAEGGLLRKQAALQNGKIAVELGAAGHVVATEWANSAETLQLIPHNTAEAALHAVANQEADAAIVDAVSGRIGIATIAGLELADEAVTVEPFAFVVRRDDSQLLRQLNTALGNLKENGSLNELITTWMR